jgi:histone acetyltransferase
MSLNAIKGCFAKQLPNMGGPYIARLVFDLGAESVYIIHKGVIMGAISSRLFVEQGFIEIVFCAVDSSLQEGGYGRLLMDFLKGVVQARGIHDILTCADNEAVGYFKKQGFNEKEIRMEPSRWVGYIKDYDQVTLVHCLIHPEIDYLNFQKTVLARQLANLADRTGIQISKPIPEFAEEQPSLPHAVYHVSLPLPLILRRRAPALRSAGILRLLNGYDDRCRILREKFIRILEALKSDPKNADIFMRPVTEEIAPNYFDVIQSPMDLWSIENRLKRYDDYYKRPEIFAIDVALMCDNAKHFNPPDSQFYRHAIELFKKFKRLYAAKCPDSEFAEV